MKNVYKLIGLALFLVATPGVLKAEPVSIDLGGNTFILPLQVVSGVQLYSFEEGRGYPALETVLIERKSFRFTFGAAAVLGTSANVPFVSLQTRLTEKFFDINDNNLYFGVWVGRQSRPNEVRYGISAGIPLW